MCSWIGILALGPLAHAQHETITRAAARAPADADLVLVVDQAAQWGREPLGEALRAIAAGLLKTGDSLRAWETLSRQLGMSEAEAFDALLGRRAMFVQRSGANDGDASTWAIVSTVQRETEEALRARLKPAPRKFEQGLTVMTIEDGRFLLVVQRVEMQSLLLLGPANSPGMFEQLAPSLGKPGAPAGGIGALPIVQDLRSLDRPGAPDSPRALLLARLSRNQADWVGLLTAPRGRELVTEMFVRSPHLGKTETPEPWSRDVFDELQRGAYFAAMEWGLKQPDQWSALTTLSSNFPFLARPFGRPDLLGQRICLALRPSDDALASLALSVETPQPAVLALVGDEMIADALQNLWPQQPEEARAALNLAGAFPQAIREVDLSQRLGALLPSVFDRGPTLAWSYAAGGSSTEGGGWWTLGLDRAGVEQMAEGLTRERRRGERPAPWISLGVARPAQFLAELERRRLEIPSDAAPLASALKRVDVFSWELFRTLQGAARGRLIVRILEDPQER